MGWELHITRRDHIADEGCDIAREEWIAVVEADPEMIWDEAGDTVIVESEDVAWPFLWLDGAIDVKHAEGRVIAKMVALANVLDAEVQDGNGYVYRADGTSFLKETHSDPTPPHTPGGKRGPLARLFGRG